MREREEPTKEKDIRMMVVLFVLFSILENKYECMIDFFFVINSNVHDDVLQKSISNTNGCCAVVEIRGDLSVLMHVRNFVNVVLFPE